MPHDVNGNLLQPGDLVNIPATVIAVYQGGGFCNADLEFEHIMPGRTSKGRYSAINTRQVVKRVGGRIYPCGCRASGSDNLPEYCSEHGTPPDTAASK
jgi:hypothetical protein